MHTISEKRKLKARVHRLRGQIEAIDRALDNDVNCERILHLLAGARGAMAGLMFQVIEDHVSTHLVDERSHPGALKRQAAVQLLEVVRAYIT